VAQGVSDLMNLGPEPLSQLVTFIGEAEKGR
jgi:hypothetical protein